MKKVYSLAILMFLMLTAFQIPSKFKKKVDKEISAAFSVEDFSLQTVKVSDALNAKLPVKITDVNLHKIVSKNKTIGYAFIENAPSKTADFDYLLLLDTTGTVVKSKVLIYREEYGGEIGSKRWLSQFIGKKTSDKLTYKANVDAISGATISVKSMIKSMNEVLQTMEILKINKAL